ncbi:MAG: transketolase [Magnetococcales bacterium]|nr:transketolase [Magnetococcales bacterium]
MDKAALERLCVTTIRMLAVDMIERANSGHPGMPLGAAPMAFALWTRVLRHNPANPSWFNRDRFILSAGHASSLLYALLHLSGYGLTLDELKNFRQFGSRTPGHPEYGVTPGVETSTGPLGQGLGNGVGMALAERRLADGYNRSEFLPLVDHFTYVLLSDGDVMEGIAAEAASLAGHLCLGKLICLYDSNRISIDGDTDLTFTEDIQGRFEACEWQVLRVDDGEDLDAIEAAILTAQEDGERPSLIIVRTEIGYGSPKANSESCHGAPLGGTAALATRRFFNWPDATFHVPEEVTQFFQRILTEGREAEAEWSAVLEAYQTKFPQDIQRFRRQIRGELPAGWEKALDKIDFGGKPIATRAASGKCLNALAPILPCLLGGSADVGISTQTLIEKEPERNLYFGVREHAMGAMLNGIALHGGWIPYGGTFLAFSDYMRGAVRMSALMGLHVIYVLTHDSVSVGEDGPTHQPVEHVAALRLIPNLIVLRPADAIETVGAWRHTMRMKKPVALILSRQALPIVPGNPDLVARGAYVLVDCEGTPDILLIGTGGELHLVVDAQKELAKQGVAARVISMPSWELFTQQSEEYQRSIFPPGIRNRLAVEAGSSFGWRRWVGPWGDLVCIDQFGISGPGEQVLAHYGYTVPNVVSRALALIEKNRQVPA